MTDKPVRCNRCNAKALISVEDNVPDEPMVPARHGPPNTTPTSPSSVTGRWTG